MWGSDRNPTPSNLFFIRKGMKNLVYRITFDRFLVYAIDYFSLEDLSQIQYLVLSAKITNLGKLPNVVKINNLYPTVEIVTTYAESGDKAMMHKMYWDYLSGEDEYKSDEWNPIDGLIYRAFINPLLHHYDIMIVCDRAEDDYVDVLVEYLERRFEVPVINLNQLFDTGSVDTIYIDRDQIQDNAVDIRRKAATEEMRSLSTSRDGRIKLIGMMSHKEKKRKLRELGINSNGLSDKEISQLIYDAWVDED